MGKIAVVTDSTCDLPSGLLAQRRIFRVSLSVAFGEREYLDGADLTAEQFYTLLAAGPEWPSTSQPAPGTFLTLFQNLKAEGFTHVLCLVLTRKFSGTFNSAQQAAKMAASLAIEVVDSKSASWGLGLLVLYAQGLVDAGLGWAEVLEKVRARIETTTVFFSVDTLDALQRGGRIGKAKAFVGRHLGLRPILELPGRSGEIEVRSSVLSHAAALKALTTLALEHARSRGLAYGLCVLHAHVPDQQQALQAALLAEGLLAPKVMTGTIGAVIGAHLGPDGWGVALC
jgi:DegV family protein with EDD domain